MQFDFLTPRAERLRADGAVEAVHGGGALGRLRRPVLLLARELCSFSLFEASSLPGNRRRQAARIFARTASPYVAGGAALTKCGNDFGVWWWDLERVSPLIEGRYGGAGVSLRPETMAQPSGADWRIVRLAQGHEAQLWRHGALAASVWRRTPFDATSWTAFTRLQRQAPVASEQPPMPQVLPISTSSEAFSLAASEISRDQMIALGVSSFAMVVACLVAFLLGQGLHLSHQSDALERDTAAILASTPRAEKTRALDEDRQVLAAYRQIEARTNPVGAAGAAIGIVAFHDLTPLSLDASETSLSLTLPYSAVELADELVVEFEESGFFENIQPRTDAGNQTLTFEMTVLSSVQPLSPAGE